MRFTGLMSLPLGAPIRSSSKLGRWIEVLLMFALAVQVARLFWVMLSPPNAFGDWRPFEPAIAGPQARAACSRPSILSTGRRPQGRRRCPDGHFASSQALRHPPQRRLGPGSAIIAIEAGVQNAYAVGDEITPGVTLKAVSFDHVTIARNGADETLYIDQSGVRRRPVRRRRAHAPEPADARQSRALRRSAAILCRPRPC